MEKQIFFAIKSLEKKVVDIYSKIKNTGSSPEQLTLDAIIYNAKAPIKIGNPLGEGVSNESVRHIIPLPNGKFLIHGQFFMYQGVRVNGLARVNSDFTLDPTYTGGGNRFFSNTGVSPSVTSETFIPILDSNQNLYMAPAGAYAYDDSLVGGSVRLAKILKLNSNGDIDQTFMSAIGTGFNDTISSLLVLPDNSIIIAGRFTTFNGTTINRILKLSSSGVLDSSFNANVGTGFNNSISQAMLTPAGKIIIVGNFSSYNEVARNRIAQLNTDGTLDSSFNYSSGITSNVTTYPRIAVDTNTGNIYLSDQSFFVYSGITTNRKIIRIDSAGNYDASFAFSTTAFGIGGGSPTLTMYFDPSLNKLYYGGTPLNCESYANGNLYRLNLNGSLDTTLPNNSGQGSSSNFNYIKPIGTDYFYLCHTSIGNHYSDIPGDIHRGFTIINKNTGKLATTLTRSLNHYD
jgi:uncharacterized delta-60 repeat protein